MDGILGQQQVPGEHICDWVVGTREIFDLRGKLGDVGEMSSLTRTPWLPFSVDGVDKGLVVHVHRVY